MFVLVLAACLQDPGTFVRANEVSTPAVLERRLAEIDAKLGGLAAYSLWSGMGAIGSRSQPHESADSLEWIEIDLGRLASLDKVMLVPAIRRDFAKGFQSDGFPLALRLVAGTGDDRKGNTIAEFSADDGLLPRIAPLVVACGGATASWIRVEAITLSSRAFDGKFVFQLSEILVFSGEENVALHKPVKSSAAEPVVAQAWNDAFVVDGFLPYLMAAPSTNRSIAYLNLKPPLETPALTMDLGEAVSVNAIRFHAVDQSDTVPQAFAGDLGIPGQLLVEGAENADFSDVRPLAELHHKTMYEVGPIMTIGFPAASCRYVRFRIIKPNTNPLYGTLAERFGFAEIEILSDGRNVALHKAVSDNIEAPDLSRLPGNLTDGMNFFGAILPLRTWLEQLAERHELERERPLIREELNKHYARQKAMLKGLSWLAALLGMGVVTMFWVDRVMRRRAIERTRNSIAADLHDELGADLHAIGLLSDLADGARSSPNKLAVYLRRLRSMTERAGKAARHCTNLIEAKELYGDLAEDMRRTAGRILADLEHRMEIENPEELQNLDARRRIDLLLFFQECLTNIIRHSCATTACIRLGVKKGRIELVVSDNGQGLEGGVPPSLKRRARLMGARVEALSSELNGACIRLKMKVRRFGFLR